MPEVVEVVEKSLFEKIVWADFQIFKENIETCEVDLAHFQTSLLQVEEGPLRDYLLLTTSRITGNLQEAGAIGNKMIDLITLSLLSSENSDS